MAHEEAAGVATVLLVAGYLVLATPIRDVGEIVLHVGVPLAAGVVGLTSVPLAAKRWPELLSRWVIPCIFLYAVNLAAVALLLPDRAYGLWWAPAIELSLFYGLALVPVVLRATRRVYTPPLLFTLAAAVALMGAPALLTALTCAVAGARLGDRIVRIARSRDWFARDWFAWALGCAFLAACLPWPQRLDGIRGLLLAVSGLPLGLVVSGLIPRRWTVPLGRVAVPAVLLLSPAVFLDPFLLVAAVVVARQRARRNTDVRDLWLGRVPVRQPVDR